MNPVFDSLPLHILFIFIDGVGLGPEHPDNNPFYQLDLPAFDELGNNQQWLASIKPYANQSHTIRSLDANLGIEGLPQSGTGQASLFTGINCARLAGRHYGPYPHSKTRRAISEKNIFQQVKHLNLAHAEPAAFANAYPDVFFKQAEARNRWTVTTLSCIEADIPVRKLSHVREGRAITAELTGQAWINRLGLSIPLIDEKTAADNLAQISRHHPFTLFEYYLTDKAGHSQKIEKAAQILTSLDVLFGQLLRVLDFSRTLLLITSDHGNLEDLSTKSHTRNPVPLIAYGAGAHHFYQTHSLIDVTPAIINALGTETSFNSVRS